MAVSFYFLSSNMKMTRIPFFRFIHNTGSVVKACGRGIFFRLKVNERGFLSVKMVFEYKRKEAGPHGRAFLYQTWQSTPGLWLENVYCQIHSNMFVIHKKIADNCFPTFCDMRLAINKLITCFSACLKACDLGLSFNMANL